MKFATQPQLLPLLRMIFAHNDGTQKRRCGQQGEQTAADVARPMAKGTPTQRQQHGKTDGNDADAQREVSPHLADECCEQFAPKPRLCLSRGRVLSVSSAFAQVLHHLGRHDAFKGIRHRAGGTNHVRRKEGGDDAHCHHNGVKKIVGNMERNAE